MDKFIQQSILLRLKCTLYMINDSVYTEYNTRYMYDQLIRINSIKNEIKLYGMALKSSSILDTHTTCIDAIIDYMLDVYFHTYNRYIIHMYDDDLYTLKEIETIFMDLIMDPDNYVYISDDNIGHLQVFKSANRSKKRRNSF